VGLASLFWPLHSWVPPAPNLKKKLKKFKIKKSTISKATEQNRSRKKKKKKTRTGGGGDVAIPRSERPFVPSVDRPFDAQVDGADVGAFSYAHDGRDEGDEARKGEECVKVV
jgi:hypothetical protein